MADVNPPAYRYEVKFVLDRPTRHAVERWIAGAPGFRRAHLDRRVNSVYFDDPALSTAADNIAGIANRRKFRVRSYGAPWDPDAPLVLEVKAKRGRLGYKVQAPLEIGHDELGRMTPASASALFAADADVAAHLRPGVVIGPVVHVSYARQYFDAGGGVRLTVDDGIEFTDLRCGNPDLGIARRVDASTVAEFKFPVAVKDRVAELMTDFPAYPSRSSKYVNGLRLFGYVAQI